MKWLVERLSSERGASKTTSKLTDFVPSEAPVLVIPTRNRPTSLSGVLDYLIAFYPGARLVLADGSSPEFAAKNEALSNVASQHLKIDYRNFPQDLPLLDRLVKTFQDLPEDYYIMGADDDYPILETQAKARAFLRANPGYAACGGLSAIIRMLPGGSFETGVFRARSLEQNNVEERCRDFASDYFATYYLVCSRQTLLSRFDRTARYFVTGFMDYQLGLHDLCLGPVNVLDAVSYVRSSNPIHSYIRVRERLDFLRNGETILALADQIAEDLVTNSPKITEKRARRTAEDLVLRNIHFLTRPRSKTEPDAWSLFMADADRDRILLRAGLQERIEFVRNRLRLVENSDDNRGEEHTRSTID